jgi:hypothetical protein
MYFTVFSVKLYNLLICNHVSTLKGCPTNYSAAVTFPPHCHSSILNFLCLTVLSRGGIETGEEYEEYLYHRCAVPHVDYRLVAASDAGGRSRDERASMRCGCCFEDHDLIWKGRKMRFSIVLSHDRRLFRELRTLNSGGIEPQLVVKHKNKTAQLVHCAPHCMLYCSICATVAMPHAHLDYFELISIFLFLLHAVQPRINMDTLREYLHYASARALCSPSEWQGASLTAIVCARILRASEGRRSDWERAIYRNYGIVILLPSYHEIDLDGQSIGQNHNGNESYPWKGNDSDHTITQCSFQLPLCPKNIATQKQSTSFRKYSNMIVTLINI